MKTNTNLYTFERPYWFGDEARMVKFYVTGQTIEEARKNLIKNTGVRDVNELRLIEEKKI